MFICSLEEHLSALSFDRVEERYKSLLTAS